MEARQLRFSYDALYNERGTQKYCPPDEAKKRGKEKQMGVFKHKDPWQHHRAELIERGKAGTALLRAEPEAVVPILLSVSPEAKFTYQPYLTFLNSEGWATERAKFPEEFLAACSLRLLVLSVTSQGILPGMWRFSLAAPVFEDLSAHGLSLLRRLLALLGQRPDYSVIYTLALGSLQAVLITTVRRQHPHFLSARDLWKAETIGYYLQGEAAYRNNDLEVAVLSWTQGEIAGSNCPQDLTYLLCKKRL